MTKTVEYTHHYLAPLSSSVIKEVFYNERSYHLYVVLKNTDWQGKPVVAGYGGVQPKVYNNFASAQSAGTFWNTEIKNKGYTTLNGDVNFVPFEPAKTGNAEVKMKNPNPKNREFTLVVHIDGDLRFNVDEAGGLEAAIAKVKKIVEDSLIDGTFYVKEVKNNH